MPTIAGLAITTIGGGLCRSDAHPETKVTHRIPARYSATPSELTYDRGSMIIVRPTGVQVRCMITLPELAAQDLGSFLASDTKDRFGSSHARLAELIPFAARLALDCIGNSDALYHNVEHTMLVTLAGHEIFKGRALLMPSTPTDYSNFIVACLTHDIGYIRGIVKGDDAKGYVVDGTGRKISLPRGSRRMRVR